LSGKRIFFVVRKGKNIPFWLMRTVAVQYMLYFAKIKNRAILFFVAKTFVFNF